MSGAAPRFLLIGNGPYANRGCEAIVRGTMEILRREFGPGTRATVATFAAGDVVARQTAAEIDPGLSHVAMDPGGGRWSRDWLHLQALKLVRPRSAAYYLPRDLPFGLCDWPYRKLRAVVERSLAVLEIGGDNYSMDYGWPERFLAIDRYVRRRHRPLVLWGASVGPFDSAPPQAQEAMFRHLARMQAVFVRESISRDYLIRQTVPNVQSMCDPAFAMPSRSPAAGTFGEPLPEDSIGMNFSGLLARSVTGGDLERWTDLCADIVERTVVVTRRPVLLIPHVTSDLPAGDDFVLLQKVLGRLGRARDHVRGVPGNLSAAEIKWVISRCAAFMGARTHATIAALSSGVPTLSLAYSRKAYGINQDLFGSQEFCMDGADLSVPGKVAARLSAVLGAADSIRQRLREKLPEVVRRAYAAGPRLRHVLHGAAEGDRSAPA